jgi:hypothetical protein
MNNNIKVEKPPGDIKEAQPVNVGRFTILSGVMMLTHIMYERKSDAIVLQSLQPALTDFAIRYVED